MPEPSSPGLPRARPFGAPPPGTMPSCQALQVASVSPLPAPPIPPSLRSGAESRRAPRRLRLALLVAAVTMGIVAAPFVLMGISAPSGPLHEAMSDLRLLEGRSVATTPVDRADGVPLIKADPAPYKQAVPPGAEAPPETGAPR